MPSQAEAQQFTPQEFAAKVKAKYPVYANIPDDQLVTKVIAKYPQYKASIKFDTSAQRGAAQATGLQGSPQLTGKQGMSAALGSPQIKELEKGNVEGAKLLTDIYGGKAVAGMIGSAFKPTMKMVPVVSKLLDAQGNPIVSEVEQVGKSAAGRAAGLTKEGIGKILTWMNKNQLPTYLLLRTAEQLGLSPHKAMKILHVASKE